jgi:hypothetical protein
VRSQDVSRTDRRWLIAVVALFAVAAGAVFGAREVYRATAPHPQLSYLFRRVKYYANALLRQGRLKPTRR